MKKNLFFVLFALIALSFSSCDNDDDDDNTGIPGEVTITETITGNSVAFSAVSENAISFAWDLGNGQTPTGQEVTGTYSFPGTYTITCTAAGRDGNTVGTKEIAVAEGDPDIFSIINVALSGYNTESSNSETVWVWSQGIGNFTVGPKYGTYDLVGDTTYFDVVDESWWGADIISQEAEEAFDDEYQFKLNAGMEYVNNFGDAFMLSWFWANYHYSLNYDVWCDDAYADYVAPASSWSVEVVDNINDSLSFTTNINGTDYAGAYILKLTNNGRLGIESVGTEYQICKLANDTLFVRYDNTVPIDMTPSAEMIENEITPGEPEWVYMRLVKKQ